MGDLVTVAARGVLIEREDHAQVVAELKAFAEANPQEVGDHRGVVAAADLRGALAAADFASALDEHGDLVELRFLGDKPPHDASEHWPVSLLGAITWSAARARWPKAVSATPSSGSVGTPRVTRTDPARASCARSRPRRT